MRKGSDLKRAKASRTGLRLDAKPTRVHAPKRLRKQSEDERYADYEGYRPNYEW